MIKHSTMLLPNNVRLVLSEDKSKNQTYAEISVLYGGMTEKYKYQEKKKKITPGLAHLMEHYLVEHNLYGNMFDYLKDQYVEFNATTNAKKTCFFINTVFDFERHLEELIKIVNVPTFDADALEKTKKPIIEEIKRTADRPYVKFTKKMNDCTYHDCKFRETTGTIENVKSIKIEELEEVHNLFYQPENQVIFIAGNFDSKKIIKKITEIYESINRKKYEYEILDKKETAKVRRKKGHVKDSKFDDLITISFKIDLKKLTPKERVKLTFYLSHFLSYNFNDSSKVYQELTKEKDTIYSLSTSTSFFIKDICFLDISMYGNNLKKFKRLVFDVIKNKYTNKELFDLWKKETLINIVVREGRCVSSGLAYLDNILTFDYFDVDKISDIEKFSIEDFKSTLDKLDFSNYCIVSQTKK